jgi:hypothetical protein
VCLLGTEARASVLAGILTFFKILSTGKEKLLADFAQIIE